MTSTLRVEHETVNKSQYTIEDMEKFEKDCSILSYFCHYLSNYLIVFNHCSYFKQVLEKYIFIIDHINLLLFISLFN